MPAFMKIGDIKGEATSSDHKDWVRIDSMSAPIHRSIPPGARDQQRARGETTLGDIVCVRQMDKSSTKLSEACASGKFFPEVEIHLCTTIKGKQEPVMKYKLKNAIVTSYSFHGTGNMDPQPSEEITLNFTEVEWNYVILDPETGDNKGVVPGKYAPGTGKAG
jgi:type VI secretion system secreted protein Hcp